MWANCDRNVTGRKTFVENRWPARAKIALATCRRGEEGGWLSEGDPRPLADPDELREPADPHRMGVETEGAMAVPGAGSGGLQSGCLRPN